MKTDFYEAAQDVCRRLPLVVQQVLDANASGKPATINSAYQTLSDLVAQAEEATAKAVAEQKRVAVTGHQPNPPAEPDPNAPRFGCVKCGGERIEENNEVSVRLRVQGWDAEGEPKGFDYPWSVIDDTITTTEGLRWYCSDCGEDFDGLRPLNDAARAIVE